MNNQTIFNRVSKHLLKQMKRSSLNGDNSVCLYRGPNGLKCAVGILIPDKDYRDDMEYDGTVINPHSEVRIYLSQRGYSADNFELLDRLQRLHDNCYPKDWKRELVKVAKTFDLKFTS